MVLLHIIPNVNGAYLIKKKIYKVTSNNKRTKRIAELFERQKLRKQRLAAIEARQKARMNMAAKLTKKKS